MPKYTGSLPLSFEQSCGQSHETWKNEKSGSGHQGFYPNALFFHDAGYKTNRIIKSFSKETRKQIYLFNILNFCEEKVTFIVFPIKDVSKLVPYYQQINCVFW